MYTMRSALSSQHQSLLLYVFKIPFTHKTTNLLHFVTKGYNLDSYPKCRTQTEGYVTRNRYTESIAQK
jgi:hypothetical protein